MLEGRVYVCARARVYAFALSLTSFRRYPIDLCRRTSHPERYPRAGFSRERRLRITILSAVQRVALSLFRFV